MAKLDVKPVRPVKDSYYCPHCRRILCEAVQSENGDRLCLKCCEEIRKLPLSKCEDCEIFIPPGSQVYPDRAVRREISELTVHCSHVDTGCQWTGSLKTVEQHVSQCPHRELQCPYPGCESCMTATQLEAHVLECVHRQVECKYCGQHLSFSQLAAHHERDCESYPELCKQCKTSVARKDMELHIDKECSLVQCTVCKQIVDKETTDEVNDEGKTCSAHLSDPKITFEHVNQLGKRTELIKSEQTIIKADIQQLKANSAGVNTVKGLEIKTDALRAALESLQSDNLRILVQNLQMRISDQNEKIEEQALTTGKLTLQLSNLATLVTEKGPTHFTSNGIATSSVHRREYLPSSSNLESRIAHIEKSVEELQRNAAMMKVHISELELQLQASLASTHNGCFLWRIPEIARRKRDAFEGRITSIYSPPFYTGRNGYKMCIRAYLNGDGSGKSTHLSVFFVLMRGEYDPLLKWPFECKVSLILVDQELCHHIIQTFKPSPDSSSFQRPRSDMNVASGCPQFASLSVLNEGNYVKNDIAYLKCIVDTSKVTHP